MPSAQMNARPLFLDDSKDLTHVKNQKEKNTLHVALEL